MGITVPCPSAHLAVEDRVHRHERISVSGDVAVGNVRLIPMMDAKFVLSLKLLGISKFRCSGVLSFSCKYKQ